MYSSLKYNSDGLIPAIIQDVKTNKVLMQAYMNKEALARTVETNKVTFFSRSRQKLWTKGEESGNFLLLEEIRVDCDSDSLLIKVTPQGPTCHTGDDTCWQEKNVPDNFLMYLEDVLRSRKASSPEESYTAKLFAKGTNKIAQKVGEEAVELVIEAMDRNDTLFLNEAADLIYHYIVLLIDRGYGLKDIMAVLKERHK